MYRPTSEHAASAVCPEISLKAFPGFWSIPTQSQTTSGNIPEGLPVTVPFPLFWHQNTSDVHQVSDGFL